MVSRGGMFASWKLLQPRSGLIVNVTCCNALLATSVLTAWLLLLLDTNPLLRILSPCHAILSWVFARW